MKRPVSRVRAKAAWSSGISGAYCAFTSTCGIGGTASHGSGPAATQDQIRRNRDDSRYDRVLDVTEVLVELVVACAEPPAHAREREAPDRAPERRQHRVAREARLENPGRDRDER